MEGHFLQPPRPEYGYHRSAYSHLWGLYRDPSARRDHADGADAHGTEHPGHSPDTAADADALCQRPDHRYFGGLCRGQPAYRLFAAEPRCRIGRAAGHADAYLPLRLYWGDALACTCLFYRYQRAFQNQPGKEYGPAAGTLGGGAGRLLCNRPAAVVN